MDQVVKQCDDAFDFAVRSCSIYKEMLYKWSLRGTMIAAVNQEICGYAVVYSNDYKDKEAFIPMIGVKKKYQKRMRTIFNW